MAKAEVPDGESDPLAPLLADALERDPKALRRLVDGVAPDVVRVIGLIVGASSSDVDDLTQEALLAFVRSLPQFRGECTLRRYARRIAARTAMTNRRRAARKAAHHEQWQQRELGEPGVAASSSSERRRAILRELLIELPEAQAEVLVLRIVLGCSLREIADATGAPLNTVRSRLRIAKEALRRRISGDPVLRELFEVP